MAWTIVFTGHATEKYKERLVGKIDSSFDEGQARQKILEHGVFYQNPDGGLLCVVSNMTVYGIAVEPAGPRGEGELKIRTTFPYHQGKYRNFQRVNVPGIGKQARDAENLEALIARGVKLAHVNTRT
jgi:hypothetical protein